MGDIGVRFEVVHFGFQEGDVGVPDRSCVLASALEDVGGIFCRGITAGAVVVILHIPFFEGFANPTIFGCMYGGPSSEGGFQQFHV